MNKPLITLTLIDELDYTPPIPTFNPPKVEYSLYRVVYRNPSGWCEVKTIRLSPEKALELANYYMLKYYPKDTNLQVAYIKEY